MIRALNPAWVDSEKDVYWRRLAWVRWMEEHCIELLIDTVFFTEIGWLVVRMYDDDYNYALCVWDGYPRAVAPLRHREWSNFPTIDMTDYIPF